MKVFLTLLFLFPVFSWAGENCGRFLTAESSAVSRKSPLLEEFQKQKGLFSRKQQAVWEEALTHLLEDLDEVNEKSSTKNRLLKEEIEAVVKKLPEIFNGWRELEAQDSSGYFKEGFLGVWATLTVHSHEMLETRKKEMDYQRLFAILKTIKDFDTSRAKFSFYKIRRAIQGRFSIKEYVNCKL